MKRMAFVLVLILAAGLPALMWAQTPSPAGTEADQNYGGRMGPGGGMMGGGMMGGGMMDMMGGGMGMMGAGGGMMGGAAMMGLAPDLFDRAQQMLGLTDDQVSRLRSLWLDYVRATATPRTSLQVARAELQNLLSGRNVNMTQVETRIRDIARLRGDLDLAETRLVVQAKALLTPEQLQKMRSFWSFERRGTAEGGRSGTPRGTDDYRRGGGGMMGPGGMMGND